MASQTLPAVTGDKDRSLQEAVSRLTYSPRPGGEAADPIVTAVRRLPAVSPSFAPYPGGTDDRLIGALAARGIGQLYSHQASAFSHVLAGRNVVTITPTASGKTLCYNAPVLNAILQDPSTRALYLFPTKALAQDQLAELHALSALVTRDADLEIGVFTYDGDTPSDARRAIRGKAHVVLSNPDMLHSGILPHHPRWAKLFENLRFVVIDELHAYRGVFGSHLSNIMRRLRRVCRHYGSDSVFICSSATIANPRELAEGLTEKPFALVDDSGAPRGEKFFLFVNPPVVNAELGIRRSYLAEARRVSLEFLKHKLQLILFAQSRLSVELLTMYLKDAFHGVPGAADVIRGYRGGYLPNRRREIERGLREGVVRAVVSTNALELGIDIGALDVSVMAGYPGTIAATWQRAGRAGRRNTRSAAVLVASSAPIDQFIIRNPSYFFDASPEHALINPDNLHILLDHVKCAAFELPFGDDETFGRENVQDVLSVLSEEGFVHHADGQWNWTSESYPADAVSLRSISSDNFVVVDVTQGERVIGETDFTSGPSTLHEKAIYIVEGQLFQVERLDFNGRKAFVRAVECDYYTDAITYTKVTILEEFASEGPAKAGRYDEEECSVRLQPDLDDEAERSVRLQPDLDDEAERSVRLQPDLDDEAERGVRLQPDLTAMRSHGEVHVVSRVVGFKKIKFYTNENVGSGELDLPEQQMHTSSYWLTIPSEVMAALRFGGDDRRDGVVGLAFAMRHIAQLLLMCDRHDIGISVDGGSLDRNARTGGTTAIPAALAAEPNVFIYDNYPGGIGFSRPLYELHHVLLERTRELIDGCPCESGCPSCVGPEGNTGPHAKAVALQLLDSLLPGASAALPPADGCAIEGGNEVDFKSKLRAIVQPSPKLEERTGPASTKPEGRSRELTYEPDLGGYQASPSIDNVAEQLGGRPVETAYGQCLVIDRRYESDRWHGDVRIGECELESLGSLGLLDPNLRSLSEDGPACTPRGARGRTVFIDLETTGLSGGAGTVAFLVGCGFYDLGAFHVRQFLLTSYAAERALLAAATELFDEADLIVTYNGKTFDVPVMETRWSFHRMDTPLDGVPHFDALHPARRLWRARADEVADGGCRLTTLERLLFDVRRVGDVHGFEIPARFFHFMRSGDARSLEPVLEHNRLDLVSLAAVTARAARLMDAGADGCPIELDEREAIAVGRIFERAGHLQRAEACYRRGTNAESLDVRAESLYRLGLRYRRDRRFAEAAEVWQELVALTGTRSARRRQSLIELRDFALEALAIHQEHRERDLGSARELAQFALDETEDGRRADGYRHRLARLERKLEARTRSLGPKESAQLLWS